MDDDCYPVINMNSTNVMSRQIHQNTNGGMHFNSIHNICSNDSSASISSSGSDVDIDDSNVKDEPLSPDSSCPPSPNNGVFSSMNVNLSNMAAYTNTNLVFEHKVSFFDLLLSNHFYLFTKTFKKKKNHFVNKIKNIIIWPRMAHYNSQLLHRVFLRINKYSLELIHSRG